MEFAEVVRRRRMVRNYQPDRPVPPEVVDRLLSHAIRAPSAGFSQGWEFLVLSEAADRERFWAATSPPNAGGRWLAGMRNAPLIVVPHSDKEAYLSRYAEPDKGWTDRDEARWPVPYWHVDAGMAALLMLQTCVDEGLGACFFGIDAGRLTAFRDAFGVPQEWAPTGVVAVGHPEPGGAKGSPARRRRKPMADVVHRGRW